MPKSLLLLALAGLLPLLSGWQEPPAQTDIQISVLAIRATRDNSDISPQLRELAKKLKKQFTYTGYKLENRAEGRTEVGKALQTPTLEGGYVVHVLPKKREGKRTEMQVRVVQGRRVKLDTTYTANCGAYQLTLLDLPGVGDDLILAVSAR